MATVTTLPKTNQAAVDPTGANDSTQGYLPESRWINTTSNEEFVCLDASVGAAVWKSTTSGGGGGGAVDSVFGRTGAVVAEADDYDWTQVSVDSSLINPPPPSLDSRGVAGVTDVIASAGVATGFTFSDNLDGTFDIDPGIGSLRVADSDIAPLEFFFTTAPITLVPTDNDTSFVFWEYNAGAPQLVVSTTKPSEINTNIFLGTVYREGTTLELTPDRVLGGNLPRQIALRLAETAGLTRALGIIIDDGGTLHFTVTAGKWWLGLDDWPVGAFDSNVSTFRYFFRDGIGGWNESNANIVDNARYDDGSGTLANLTGTRRGLHWVYRSIDGELYVLYGQDNYSASNATEATAPNPVPPQLQNNHASLIGKLTVKRNDAEIELVESSFADTLNIGGVTNHGDLAGLFEDDHPQYTQGNEDTVDPTVNDDNTQGWRVGATWVNTTSDASFKLVDATTGAAVWNEDGGAQTLDQVINATTPDNNVAVPAGNPINFNMITGEPFEVITTDPSLNSAIIRASRTGASTASYLTLDGFRTTLGMTIFPQPAVPTFPGSTVSILGGDTTDALQGGDVLIDGGNSASGTHGRVWIGGNALFTSEVQIGSISSGVNFKIYDSSGSLGTLGQVLTSDGTFATWQTPAAGGGDVSGGALSVVGEVPTYTDASGKVIGRSNILFGSASPAVGTRTLGSVATMVGGHIVTGGTLNSSGTGTIVLGGVAQFSGTASINATGTGGAIAMGFIQNLTGTSSINSNTFGSLAIGFCSIFGAGTSQINAFTQGGFAGGFCDASTIECVSGANGAFVHGYANAGGILRATIGFGAFVSGSATGAGASIIASGSGAAAIGSVTGTSTITASGAGALAGGNAGAGNAITASNAGNIAWGLAGSGSIIASGSQNCIQFAIGTNAQADSLQVGNTTDGIRLTAGGAPTTPHNGDIWVDGSGDVNISSSGGGATAVVFNLPNITGSRGGNAALASLLTALAAMNLITDGTSA